MYQIEMISIHNTILVYNTINLLIMLATYLLYEESK